MAYFLGRESALYPGQMFFEGSADTITERREIGTFLQPVSDPDFSAARTGERPVQRTKDYHRNIAANWSCPAAAN